MGLLSSGNAEASLALHVPAGGAREAGQVVAVLARGARVEMGRQAGGEQQLEAEGELVPAPRQRGAGVEQRQLVAQQVEGPPGWDRRSRTGGTRRRTPAQAAASSAARSSRSRG